MSSCCASPSAPRDDALAAHGRWYLPDRDADVLRRNAVIALGNVGDPRDREVWAAVEHCRADPNPMVVRHAEWAAERLRARAAEAPPNGPAGRGDAVHDGPTPRR